MQNVAKTLLVYLLFLIDTICHLCAKHDFAIRISGKIRYVYLIMAAAVFAYMVVCTLDNLLQYVRF